MIPNLCFDIQSPDFSAAEQTVANELGQRLMRAQGYLQEHNDYYEGTQQIRHLGIAVPEQLQSLRSVIGWPRLAVDMLDERLDVQGFRMPNSQDADDNLWDIWTANLMDQESQLAHLDAMVFGRAFIVVGTGAAGIPLITVESPTNMMADFDTTTRSVRSALQVYEFDGSEFVALYTPNSTIHLRRDCDVDGATSWSFAYRDDHGLGQCPVVMLTNRARTHDRYGASEITAEVMSLSDAACRTVLGMEIAREFFGAPQRYMLGAAEGAFINPDGTPTNAWETYIGRFLAAERDEEGNLPEVGSFPAADPTPYTAILQDLSRRFSAVTGAPPHLLGFASDNPASADGIRSAEARLDKRAERKQRSFEGAWRDVMLLALRISGQAAPESAHQLDVMWSEAKTPTPVETTAAIAQQVQMGYLPAESDVTGEKLGYSAVERSRIETDRKRANASNALTAIAQRFGAPSDNPGTEQGGAEGGASGGPAAAAPAA